MNVYDADHIRNVTLVGHQGSGKTMLAEAMLFVSGALKRMGSIQDGTTTSDYHPSENERQMSVFNSLLHAEWNGYKINILDTPGYPDFIGEVISGMKVADTALFVINAADGVQVGTEVAWSNAERLGLPAMFVVNHIDKADADVRGVLEGLKARFGHGATVVQLPGPAGSRSIIDVLLMKQLQFTPGKAEPAQQDIPAEFQEEAERLHNELIENIAENDESLMELYFDKGSLTLDEMRQGLHEAMLHRQLFPIFLTSATETTGVGRLIEFIDVVCPSPAESRPVATVGGEPLQTTAAGDPVVFVYRTMAEQHVGDYSFFKVYAGSIAAGMDLENAQTSTIERLGQLFSINGRNRDAVDRMYAGDLGALVKLKNTHTNNTLRAKGKNTVIEPIVYPEPKYTVSIRAQREGEEDKLAQGLHQLAEEDPALHLAHDQHLKQMVLGGQGEMHLEIARFRLKSRFGVDVEYDKPKIAYRETIQMQSRASYRHKKQTGGAGQFADISMLVEPINGEFAPPADITVRNTAVQETPWGSKIEFIDAIVGGVIDMRRFFGAIQKGVMEATPNGPIAGYPVGDVRVVVYDGGMHPVDSNENAFKTASRMCFRDAFRKAQPVLLEPVFDLEVLVPDSHTGDVMGDLNTRRARIQGIEADGPFQKVIAQAPEMELHRYSTSLRSITQGRGIHSARFNHYEPMPRHIQDKVVAEAEAQEEE